MGRTYRRQNKRDKKRLQKQRQDRRNKRTVKIDNNYGNENRDRQTIVERYVFD